MTAPGQARAPVRPTEEPSLVFTCHLQAKAVALHCKRTLKILPSAVTASASAAHRTRLAVSAKRFEYYGRPDRHVKRQEVDEELAPGEGTLHGWNPFLERRSFPCVVPFRPLGLAGSLSEVSILGTRDCSRD